MDNEKKVRTLCRKFLQILFSGTSFCGAVGLFRIFLYRIIAWFNGVTVAVGKSATVGVIGGADGPTAVFVSTPRWTGHVISAIALMTGIVGLVLLNRSKRK